MTDLATQTQINNVSAFKNSFYTMAGTSRSFLENSNCISMEVIDGESAFRDTVSKVSMQEANEINTRVVSTSIKHARRKLGAKRYFASIQVDSKVIRNMQKDPMPAYGQALLNATNNKKDQVIRTSVFADVKAGETGDDTITFAADGGREIDATGGLTYELLVDVQQMQSSKATGVKYDGQHSELFFTDQEVAQIMKQDKMINNDYGSLTRKNGATVIGSLGMEIREVPSAVEDEIPVLEVIGGERNCFALAGNKTTLPAIFYSVRKAMAIKIIDNSHEYIEGRQIQACIEMGATRATGIQVIKIRTTPVV